MVEIVDDINLNLGPPVIAAKREPNAEPIFE
jgi:hypothetical protein